MPAYWSDGFRMFPGKKNFLRLMTDRQIFALAQRVFDILYTDFDFQKLVVIPNRKLSIASSWGERRGRKDNVPS